MQCAPLPQDEERRLEELYRTGLLDTPPEADFDDLARIAAQICGTPVALITLIDRHRQWFKARVGVDVRETPRELAFCAHALHEDELLVVPDAYDDDRFAGNPLVTGAPYVRSYAGAVLRTSGGQPLGTLCVIDHVPRRLSAEQLASLRALGRQVISQIELREQAVELQRYIHERESVERMKDEFVATVSHELRTPLTAIRGALGLLEGGVAGPLPAEATEIVVIARSNTERLIRLINDILDLEKIEAGKLELAIADLDPGALVHTSVSGIQGLLGQTGVRLQSQVRDRDTLRGDPDRLIQVLTNLLSNAVKFSPPGAQIEVEVARRGDRTRFTVRDHGPGIAADKQARLFGKFQQLDGSDTRQKGGTGLGLAISKAIVQQHGGEIGVDSVVGQGSTFWFELPLPAVTQPPKPV